MNYEIVYLEDKKVNGLKIRTTNENYKAITDIANLWAKFLEDYPLMSGRVNNKAIGLYTNYQGDFLAPYDFLTCYETKDESIFTILSGKYAKFVIRGNPQTAVGEFWSKLWNLPLERAYLSDFEEYQNNSDDFSNQEIHIYISIK